MPDGFKECKDKFNILEKNGRRFKCTHCYAQSSMINVVGFVQCASQSWVVYVATVVEYEEN